MKKLFALAFLFGVIAVNAANYPYVPGGVYPTQIVVHQQFSDNIEFNVPADGAYTFTVTSIKANAGCQRYQSCGYFYGRVDTAQLQDAYGTPIADLSLQASGLPTYKGAFTLAAGDYRLHVSGLGVGTIKHLGDGWYTVASTAPKVAAPFPCDWYDTRNLPRVAGCLDD